MEGASEKKRRLTREEVDHAQDGLLRWHIEEQDRKLSTDYLTGLSNRAVFWFKLEESLKAVREHTLEEVSVIAVDIDHFKKINDAFGHSAGDEILQRIGALLQESVRGTNNIAARMGGEELFMLIPGASKETASTEAERLRAEISDMNFGNPEVKVTASFGVASSRETTDPQELYDLADKNMYSAKGSGRNQVKGFPKKET